MDLVQKMVGKIYQRSLYLQNCTKNITLMKMKIKIINCPLMSVIIKGNEINIGMYILTNHQYRKQ